MSSERIELGQPSAATLPGREQPSHMIEKLRRRTRHLLDAVNHVLATDGADMDPELVGLIEILPVAMRGEKCRLQRLDALLRHARRCREWPRHGEQRSLGELAQ